MSANAPMPDIDQTRTYEDHATRAYGIISSMSYNPRNHHRHSIRLLGYDYSQPGAYFVTICAQNRELLFDPPSVREMILRWWEKLPEKFPIVNTDAFVIMPNHIHGIVVLVGVDPRVDPINPRVDPINPRVDPINPRVDLEIRQSPAIANPGGPKNGQSRGIALTGSGDAVTLAEVVQWLKTMTTNEYIRGVKQLGWVPFPGKLWQRNYFEHIIRNNNDFNHIRAYILDNPRGWQEDQFHPSSPYGRA